MTIIFIFSNNSPTPRLAQNKNAANKIRMTGGMVKPVFFFRNRLKGGKKKRERAMMKSPNNPSFPQNVFTAPMKERSIPKNHPEML